jgi:hypothetical protein
MFQLVKRGLALRRCGARFYRSLSPLPPLRVGIPNAIGEQAIQIGKVRIAAAVEARAFKLADIAGGVGSCLAAKADAQRSRMPCQTPWLLGTVDCRIFAS